jgi:hypothetical protein
MTTETSARPSPVNARKLIFLPALEIFNQLLLLEGVAVSGFADRFQTIFDTFERVVLFDDLVAQLTVLSLEFGQAVFDGG